MEKCNKCHRHPVEYDSPDRLCFNCWTEWWVDGMGCKNKKERQMLLKEVRRDLKRKKKHG